MKTDTKEPKPLTADEEAEFRRWSEATPYNDCRSMELGRKALATLDELRAERDEARAALDGHDCSAATQEARLQNDEDWRSKVEHQKALVEHRDALLDKYVSHWLVRGGTTHAPDCPRCAVNRARLAKAEKGGG